MPLSATRAKALKDPGRYADGGGLHLYISKAGRKSWVQRITIDRRRRDIGLGAFPSVGLAQAREKAADNRTAVAEGRDPLAEKHSPAMPSFREAARAVHAANKPRWRNDRHSASWMQTLERHAMPTLGTTPLDRIDRSAVLRVLTPIWTTRPETARRCSPQQIAERLAWETGRRVLCHESIYRFVYRQQARVKDYRWSRCLPQGETKRGWRGRGRTSPARFIAQRTPIHQRPLAVATRETFGHWEADLMSFGRSGPVVLALHERASRLLLAVRQGSKGADATAATLERLLGALPPAWRQTITFDNGTEFARHYRLHALGIQTFFCDTHSPWQKGGVENAIGRLRRPLPRSTKLGSLSEAVFTAALQLYNNMPRKCLGYRTPAEVFLDQVLHFKCESTVGHQRIGNNGARIHIPKHPLDY